MRVLRYNFCVFIFNFISTFLWVKTSRCCQKAASRETLDFPGRQALGACHRFRSMDVTHDLNLLIWQKYSVFCKHATFGANFFATKFNMSFLVTKTSKTFVFLPLNLATARFQCSISVCFFWVRDVTAQGLPCSCPRAKSIFMHGLSNHLDWMSIVRSMDKYWTKYGAGIGKALLSCR